MGKGPGSIYKECLAIASTIDKKLASKPNDDIQTEFNNKLSCCSMFEKDIRILFLENNYSDRKTELALRQWADLDLVARIPYKGFKFVAFLHAITSIRDENKQGAQ